jgi:hypothetical protein
LVVTLEAPHREEVISELTGLRARKHFYRTERLRKIYSEDPVAWVHDFIPAFELTDYQEEILDALAKTHRVATRAPRGAGKTAPASAATLWFANTFDGLDWKVVATAGGWRQLIKFLWPEIHKWARQIDFEKLGRPRYTNLELQGMSLKLSTGEAFGVASDNPDLIEGAHAENLLTIVDEAKAVPAKSWDAIEGYFSDPGHKLVLALSVPGEPAGRFHEIHSRAPGYEEWHPIHVTTERALAAGRITQEWVDARGKQWGTESPLYRTYVKAEFAGSEDAAIPLAWIEAAIERWEPETTHVLTQIGVDVADTGEDQTVIAKLYGTRVGELEYYDEKGAVGEGLEATVGHVWKATGYGAAQVPVVVDSIGVGAGVVGQLRTKGANVVGFNASEGTDWTDESTELRFLNKRSAAWWNLREILHPDNATPIALPPDEKLIGDLASPKWLPITSGGKLRLEPKDQIRKRLGRSPDSGDALVMLFWTDPIKVKEQIPW